MKVAINIDLTIKIPFDNSSRQEYFSNAFLCSDHLFSYLAVYY